VEVHGDNKFTGGVVGLVRGSGAKVIACYNTGNVEGLALTGGVAGAAYDGCTITGCYNTGDLYVSPDLYATGTGGVTGGVEDNSYIIGCYNTGAVSTTNPHVGGVAGGVQEDSYIIACYNTGTVTGTSYVGGVAAGAYTGSYITACYNAGAVSAMGIPKGGVAGRYSGGIVAACYWDNTVTPSPPKGIGNPESDTGAAPFGGADAFPPVSSIHAEWGTGDGSGSGKYWKAGTTSGGELPKLWFE
jgi:hypothetical protein